MLIYKLLGFDFSRNYTAMLQISLNEWNICWRTIAYCVILPWFYLAAAHTSSNETESMLIVVLFSFQCTPQQLKAGRKSFWCAVLVWMMGRVYRVMQTEVCCVHVYFAGGRGLCVFILCKWLARTCRWLAFMSQAKYFTFFVKLCITSETV